MYTTHAGSCGRTASEGGQGVPRVKQKRISLRSGLACLVRIRNSESLAKQAVVESARLGVVERRVQECIDLCGGKVHARMILSVSHTGSVFPVWW